MNADSMPAESPIVTALGALERAQFHYQAGAAAMDEAVHALAEAGRDDLERQLSNLRERERAVTRWLVVLGNRLGEVAP